MIQLNLLPDVKLEYLKAQRTRRMVFSISVLVTVAAVVILAILLGYGALQKKHLNDLKSDITAQTNKLKGEKDIDKILTVQNQLERLTALHSAKPAAARVFDYLNSVTPTQIGISEFNIDFTQQKVTITGTADTLANVNKYIDTLKYTAFTTDDNTQPTKAFSDVVLATFGLNTGSGTQPGQAANYSITVLYDPTIFDITQKVKLAVPQTTTTRLNTPGASNDLFQQSTTTTGGTR